MIQLAMQAHWSAVRKQTRAYWVLLALSALFASRLFPRVRFVTDSEGAEMARSAGLPYTEISDELERMDRSKSDLFALGKFAAYLAMNEPFFYLDNDAFFQEAPPARLLGAPVFAQSLEPWEWRKPKLAGAPQFSDKEPALHWNTGIFGGNDLPAIYGYAEKCLNIASDPDNFQVLRRHPRMNMVYLDQAMAYLCFGRDVESLFDASIPKLRPSKEEAAAVSYTHLLGSSKDTSEMQDRVARRLEKEDYKLYARVLSCTESL